MMTQPQFQHKKSQISISQPPQQNIPTRIELTLDCSVSSSSYLTDDFLIALGLQNGTINVIASNKGTTQYILKSSDNSPISCISLNSDKHLKNAILITHSNGTLEYWHTTSKQLLFQKKYQQFLYCCQINTDGTKYVFAGDQGHLMLSNMDKGKPKDLQQGHLGAHSNRVFCLKWNKYNQNCFISGGWDKAVLFWDIRTKTAVDKVYGCYIGGQAIDIQENQVVIGSNTHQYPLKIYDIKASKIRIIDWHYYDQQSLNSCTGVLSCCFGLNDKKTIITQTSRNQIRIFGQQKCFATYIHKDIVKAQSLSHSKTNRQFLATWNNGDIKIFTYY